MVEFANPSGPHHEMPPAALVERIGALSANLHPIGERVALILALADHAIAADHADADRLLSMLESRSREDFLFGVAYALYAAHIAIRKEEFGLAEAHCARGKRLALDNRSEAEAAVFCIARGTVAYRRGHYSEARSHLEEAVVAARRAGSRQLEGRALMNLALNLKNTGELREAERLLRMALGLAELEGVVATRARCELNLARSHPKNHLKV